LEEYPKKPKAIQPKSQSEIFKERRKKRKEKIDKVKNKYAKEYMDSQININDWVINEKTGDVFKVLAVWEWKDSLILLRDDCIDTGDVEPIRHCRLASEEEIESEILRRKS
jgi:hypothetical protein